MKTSDIFVKNLVNKKLLLAAFYHLTYQHDSKDFNICNYKDDSVTVLLVDLSLPSNFISKSVIEILFVILFRRVNAVVVTGPLLLEDGFLIILANLCLNQLKNISRIKWRDFSTRKQYTDHEYA